METSHNKSNQTPNRHAAGRSVDPELYPRPDGTVYCCGEPQEIQPQDLPLPGSVPVSAELADNIWGIAGSLASCLAKVGEMQGGWKAVFVDRNCLRCCVSLRDDV